MNKTEKELIVLGYKEMKSIFKLNGVVRQCLKCGEWSCVERKDNCPYCS